MFNFMVDATKLSPRGFHHCDRNTYDGVHYISNYRTRKFVGPMKYYWVDFGLSTRLPSSEQPHLVYGKVGQEKNVPEMSSDAPYDAFKAEIFQVGMIIKRTCKVGKAILLYTTDYKNGDRITKDLSFFSRSLIIFFKMIHRNDLLPPKHCSS